MIILITNSALDLAGGTQTVVLDLCRGLRMRGHTVMIYSSHLGHTAELLASDKFPVVNNLRDLPLMPDIIHGQHHLETMSALLALPQTPAIYYIHGLVPWEERVPLHPRILGYINLSQNHAARLSIEKSIAPERCYVIENHVDLGLFPTPKSAPAQLRTAAYCPRSPATPAMQEKIQQLCHSHAIALQYISGWSDGTMADPAAIFAEYDLIFGTGRTALEAMAAGCVVSLSDGDKLGPLVNPTNVAERRETNFTISRWETDIDLTELSSQIATYRAADQESVVTYIRSQANFENAAERLVGIYEKVLAEWKTAPGPRIEDDFGAASDYLRALIPMVKAHDQIGKYREENERLDRKNTILKSDLTQLETLLEAQAVRLALQKEKLETHSALWKERQARIQLQQARDQEMQARVKKKMEKFVRQREKIRILLQGVARKRPLHRLLFGKFLQKIEKLLAD